ncbi:MAG: hypothetical protein ACM3N0_02605 [Chloroflexota bacterium]
MILAVPAAAQGPAPRGFIGISPQGQLGVADFELMQLAGIESVRMPLFWSQVEPTAAAARHPDWSSFDAAVEGAAQHYMTVFPFLWGTPPWVSPSKIEEPVASAWQRRAWLRFVGAAVRRYGPGGQFWRLNPDLPEEPIRQWEVWNEENIVTFSHNPDPERFARLIRFTGRLIHRLDPGSRVIAGGFFGRPLQIPPNVGSGDFLARLYRAGGVKPFFDGVALHPYVAQAKAMGGQIRNLRRVMRRYGDASTPLYVTELGWGSDGFESRWERGWRGQARELDRAFAMLTRNRVRWNIGGAWWFSWADAPSTCQFCDSAGLLTLERRAKPSWYAFNQWTGGDAGAVPRGSAVESLDGP